MANPLNNLVASTQGPALRALTYLLDSLGVEVKFVHGSEYAEAEILQGGKIRGNRASSVAYHQVGGIR